MKKLNKFFAILFAALGVQAASAQTDVTSTYLTNAGFDDESCWITGNVGSKTTNAINSWTAETSGDTWYYGGAVAYASSLTVNGVTPPATNPNGVAEGGALGLSAGWGCTVKYKQAGITLPAGVYTLSYKAYNANTGATQANNYIGFTSSSASYYGTTTSFPANTWTEEDVTFVLTSETSGSVSVGMGAISGGSGANAKLFVDGVTLSYKSLNDVTEANPVDLTSMASNTQAAWTGATEAVNYDGITMPAVFKNAHFTGDALSQTITGLPAGKYNIEMYCQAHSAWVTDVAAEGATGYTYLCANEYKLDVPVRNDNGATTKWLHTFKGINISSGTLKLSVTNEKLGTNWLSVYVKSITYLGPDKSLEETNFKNNIADLNALSTNDVPTAFVNKINDLKSKYRSANASSMTLPQLVDANAEIKTVLNTHPTLLTPYSNLKALIATCESIQGISTAFTDEAAATYANAIATAKTSADAATTVAELTNANNTLETARRTYMQNAYPTSGNTLDFTYLTENADWENNSNSYTTGGILHEEKYAENPWTGDVMWDGISGLANGMYKVEVYLSASAAEWNHTSKITDGDQNTCITVNNITVPVGVYKRKGVDGPTVVTLNDVMVKDGTMNFKVKNTAEGANWVIVAHKSITMTGKIDNTALQSRLKTLLEEANSIKDADMNSTICEQLNSAITNSDANSEDPDALNNMIENLESSIAAANISIADYAKLKNYIAMTAVFTDVTKYQSTYDNGEYTSDNVEPVRQELNVMRFDAASSVFKNKVEVTGWTGDLANGVRNDQHWSGETKEYYDANSWIPNFVGLKHTLSTNKTLPKGTYVLKAAGRSSADATLSLTIKDGDKTIENVEYTGKGDTGYGIDTNGNANFSAEGTYANNNAGRGWEWEFAKFELTKETEVTLHVEVDYNNIQNRFGSFSDITLWMDDATYVTVYGEALVQPLADANALVNTLPMGQQENTALVNAIALGEGTITGPDELNAAVDALKEAVKNANDWRSTYYTEKDKLVAALERFEADYNDAQNGALNYMCKSRWSTAIDKAQAAAVAKDNQTSYEVLTTATKELTDALDAATVSVGEYAELEETIDEANSLVVANVGDQPFEKPQSAADAINTTDEQALYDAATADGEGVTSVTAALKEGIATFNDTPLNAPKEGQRFYIKVATEGHPKLGNAVLATLGATSDNNPTGYGLNCNYAVNGNLTQKFTFTQVEGNIYNISIEKAEGTVYLTYGSLNGSAAGWKNLQIQATTDDAKKGEFKIEATTKEGVLKILNTIDNNYLDCQEGGSIYTDTNIQNEEFNFELASEEHTITLTISSAKWSTLILPFNAEVPEGVKAYTCAGVIDGVLTFNEPTTTIVANTPYLVGGNAGKYNFSGYGLADKDSYTEGLFTGTYVDYQTEANKGIYVLQKHDNEVAFYEVRDSAQPWVRANRCYITYEEVSGARMLRLGFGDDDTTGIDNMQFPTDNSGVTIYDTMGRKVTSMKKGNLYIMNGRKVVVK